MMTHTRYSVDCLLYASTAVLTFSDQAVVSDGTVPTAPLHPGAYKRESKAERTEQAGQDVRTTAVHTAVDWVEAWRLDWGRFGRILKIGDKTTG